MPNLFVGALSWFVGAFLSKIVYRVMFALGIGYLSLKGLELLLDPLRSQINNQIAGVSSISVYVAWVITELQVTTCISIIFSAYVYTFTLKALSPMRVANPS